MSAYKHLRRVHLPQRRTQTHRRKPQGHHGFTVIEILIALAIAAAILSILLLALPAVQRNARNRRRDEDAQKVALAIRECLTANLNRPTSCDTAAEVSMNVSEMSIFTGIHYGSDAPAGQIGNQQIPTPDEPNWLFGLKCDPSGSWFLFSSPSHAFVVTYERESMSNRCIEG